MVTIQVTITMNGRPMAFPAGLAKLRPLWRVWRRRVRSRRELAEIDDHMLRDIGLTRSVALTESAKPFWRE